MADKYLGRDDSPFGDEIWGKLDEVVVAAAKSQLSGRRLLDMQGPYGLGLKSLPLADKVVSEGPVKLISGDVLPHSVDRNRFHPRRARSGYV